MTKMKLNASTSINMQLWNIKKDGENGDMITIEFMADERYVVASEWIDVVKAAKFTDNSMMRKIDFGGAAVDAHIEANGITVGNKDYRIFGKNGIDQGQAAWDDTVYFYIMRTMQQFIKLQAFEKGKLEQLEIDHEDYVGSRQVTSVKGWQVEGADTDEKVFYYSLRLGDSSVSFFAWVYIDGELVEFCFDERGGLDEAVMSWYQHMEQNEAAFMQNIVNELEEKIAERKNEDLFDWDEGAAALEYRVLALPADEQGVYFKSINDCGKARSLDEAVFVVEAAGFKVIREGAGGYYTKLDEHEAAREFDREADGYGVYTITVEVEREAA